MKKLGKNKHKVFLYLFCIFLMLISSGFTSPLYPHYIGVDCSFFLIIARGIICGKIPYIDLFDHKGPIFFWMEAIGYLFGGRTGVFVFQCILLICDLFIIDRITELFHADFSVGALSFVSVFFTLFQHGNLTEEFCTPMILAALYYELKFLLSENEKHSPFMAYCYGIILGLLAFIRLNNAIVPCALLLCIAIVLIQKKQWGNLLGNILCGILGLATVTFPVCFYYYRHGALYDMLYGTFLHNLIYAKNNTHYPIMSSFLYYLVLYLPGICASIIFWTKWKTERNRVYISLLFATVLTYGMLVYTNVYMHYFMLGLPLFVVSVAVIGGKRSVTEVWKNNIGPFFRKPRIKIRDAGAVPVLTVFIIVMYMGLSVLSVCPAVYKTFLTDIAYDEYKQIQTGSAVIPEEERDSVIAYGVLANYYYHADIIPCYKYFTMQKWMTTEKVNVYQEFMRYLTNEHPLWVVTYDGEKDLTINKILEKNYSCKLSDGIYSYYRYNN